MTPDGVETPIGPVLGHPQRSRDRARVTAVAVVAVVVLGVGIGLTGNGSNQTASVPPSSTASAPGSAVAIPSPIPSVIWPPVMPEILPPPTPNAVLGCAPVRLGQPPGLRLTATTSDIGIFGVTLWALPGPSAPAPAGWPALPLVAALLVPAASSLGLSTDRSSCLRYVVVEYAPGAPGQTIPAPIELRTLNVSPPRASVILGSLPVGDWILRVVAYFSTGTAGQEDGTVTEQFFRVVTSATPGPS